MRDLLRDAPRDAPALALVDARGAEARALQPKGGGDDADGAAAADGGGDAPKLDVRQLPGAGVCVPGATSARSPWCSPSRSHS